MLNLSRNTDVTHLSELKIEEIEAAQSVAGSNLYVSNQRLDVIAHHDALAESVTTFMSQMTTFVSHTMLTD